MRNKDITELSGMMEKLCKMFQSAHHMGQKNFGDIGCKVELSTRVWNSIGARLHRVTSYHRLTMHGLNQTIA